ncbi:hypothetical protein [uncultured Serinicoccus sp.]|uniref:hypothetical protein n=1 Tax=uncultured Serinicoccus sp. TaxID=735514 RepID=UPI00261EF9D8|nr:hypothetical protein [uncultured Serinicoccus sp.]
MIFGRRSNEESGPTPAELELARTQYLLRTAKEPLLSQVVVDVLGTLRPEAREEWRAGLYEQGLAVEPLTAEALVEMVTGRDEARKALGRSATAAVADVVAGLISASPGFRGFASSPEAREIGVPDPDRQIARQRPRAEPPYLPGTTAGTRR